MKKWDKIIILGLLVLSFLPYIVLNFSMNKEYDKVYAIVSVDGEVYEKIPLTGQVNAKQYDITTEYGTNLLVVENEKIAIIQADCPDKLCSEPGFISKPGQSLVCLPNRLYVEITGTVDEQNETDIKVY